jgi:hypothetical protein
MNPVVNLDTISTQFKRRIRKLYSEAIYDNAKIERYCIVSIALLNNFLRAYLLSIRTKAIDANGLPISLRANSYLISYDHFINELIHIGNPRKWRRNHVGHWVQRDEPAFHTPRIFLNIATQLGCSNINTIISAMNNSWKIDVLREVRNYYAHRSSSTEVNAISVVQANYTVSGRASKILFAHDPSLRLSVLDDINNYLIGFADDIC